MVKLYDLPPLASHVGRLGDEGVVIRVALPHERPLVIKWVREIFGEGWASECDVAFSNHPPSCFIATESGGIVGFACYDSACKDFFGPAGVAEHARRRGIGKALLLASLYAMAAQGYAYAIIGGVGPAGFYAKVAGATEIEGSSPGIFRDPLKRVET